MLPKVSIVVPVYNGIEFLNELLVSLEALEYTNLEIIFSDGGSTDGSLDFLKSIKLENVRLITSKEKITAAENWTTATQHATGEFVKLICQDDILYPESIDKQVDDLMNNPTAIMAAAQRDIIDKAGKTLFRNRGLARLSKELLLVSGSNTIHKCFIEGTNILGEPLAVLFRKTFLKKVMPWDDSNPLMLDLMTYQKISKYGDIALRFESIGAFRVSNNSWSTKLAKDHIQMTKSWQFNYVNSTGSFVSRYERVLASFGRHKNNFLRQIAYTYLGLRSN